MDNYGWCKFRCRKSGHWFLFLSVNFSAFSASVENIIVCRGHVSYFFAFYSYRKQNKYILFSFQHQLEKEIRVEIKVRFIFQLLLPIFHWIFSGIWILTGPVNLSQWAFVIVSSPGSTSELNLYFHSVIVSWFKKVRSWHWYALILQGTETWRAVQQTSAQTS